MVKYCCLLLQDKAVDDLASWENVRYSDTKTKAPLCTVDACLPPLTLNRSSKHLSPRELTAFVHVFRRQAWTETPCVGCRPSLCFESLLCSRKQNGFFARRGERLLPGICVEIQEAALRHSREWQVARFEEKEPPLLRLAHTCPE